MNTELLKLARYTANKNAEKRGFVPSDGAAGGAPPPGGPGGPPPGAGGPPPPGGGGPPPGGPPGPPPPPDGGAAPPPPGGGGGGGDPMLMARLDKIEQMMQQGMMGGGGGGAGGPGMPGMKPPKPDINTVATDVFQLKKMFLHDLRSRGVEMPPDILDGPNRDPQTGMPTQTPMGGSDPSVGAMPGGGAGGAPGGPPGGGGPAPQSAIKPMQPMQGAFPSPAGPGKMAAVKEDSDVYKVGSEFKTARGLANRASQLAQAWHKIHREKVAS